MARVKRPTFFVDKERKSRKAGFRSDFEHNIANNLSFRDINYKYEDYVIEYIKPETKHRYTPDFVLDNFIIIEAKGYLTTADRKKHKWISEQFPDLDIRFLFQNASNTINKGSKTTYKKWCEKNGFKWAEGNVPEDWINEEENKINKSYLKK